MNKPIEVGDLVQVVHTCCTAFVEGSPVFKVTSFYNLRDYVNRCRYCYTALPAEQYAKDGDGPGRPGYPLSWVKRIPPLHEPQAADTREPVEVLR